MKYKYIIGGLIAVIISWLTAKWSVGSPIDFWYAMFSMIFGGIGLAMIIWGIADNNKEIWNIGKN